MYTTLNCLHTVCVCIGIILPQIMKFAGKKLCSGACSSIGVHIYRKLKAVRLSTAKTCSIVIVAYMLVWDMLLLKY